MYKVLDLFCGAGGLTLGFLEEGFNVVLGVDNEEIALKTFEYNHPESKALKIDLFNHENISIIEDFLDMNKMNIDVLVGGPPCQGFSLAGKREENDKRNILYEAMVKVAAKLKPKVVVLENVPGLLTLFEGKAKERIISDFEKLGYNMDVKVLYAPKYGVPQIRRRAFFVGTLSDIVFNFPEAQRKENEYITTEDAISDLPSLIDIDDFSNTQIHDYKIDAKSEYQLEMRKNSTKIYNHIPTKHAEKTIEHIKLVPEGGNYKNLPSHLVANFKYHESLTRYHSKKPSRTIDTGHRTHFHYKFDRIPTVRENARLQSFPDNFIFFGNKQQQYRQVGNAVPPKLGRALANKIKEYLDNEKI